MKSETAKLPKGQRYPLKPSALEAALAEAHIAIDTHLIRSPGDLFDAFFWPPNDNYLTSGSTFASGPCRQSGLPMRVVTLNA